MVEIVRAFIIVAQQLRVGLVGTGYAAKLRAKALAQVERAQLVVVAGRDRDRTQAFAQEAGVAMASDWQALVQRPDLDVIIISSSNETHAPVAEMALRESKHVVVEYPLALTVAEAESLIQLANKKERLLHVEHIELLGGLHQSLLQNLPQVGEPRYVRYATTAPSEPAPMRWSFNHDQLGFPLVAALSRIHRMTHAFGRVTAVTCRTKFWPNLEDPSYFSACICHAELLFESGLWGIVSLAKGEGLWQAERLLEVKGDRGALRFDRDEAQLVTDDGEVEIAMGGRQGLFNLDSQNVVAHLLDGEPLYVDVADSLYALKVADATRRASELGQTVLVED